MASSFERFTLIQLAASIPNSTAAGPFGSNLVSRDYVERGVPVIRGQNLSERWVGGDFVYVSQEKAYRLRTNTAKPGDIVFTQRGTLGQVSLVPAEPYDTYVISQSQMKLTVDESKADPVYVYYAAKSHDFISQIQDNAVAAGVPHINLGLLRAMTIPVPCLHEQRSIASTLSSLDDRIDNLRQTNATLEAIAQALFKSWFVDFDPVRAKAEGREPEGMDAATAALFPSEFEDSELGEIPKGWQVEQIGKMVSCLGGATPSTKEESFWQEGIHHWATPKDLSVLQSPVLVDTDRRITDAGLSKISSGLLPAGTLLLSSRAPIGYLAIAAVPTAINQGFIAMPPGGDLSPPFLLCWCKENMDLIKQSANGSTFMEISKKAFRPLPVCVPPSELLATFESVAGTLITRITENERHRSSLEEVRDTLLPRLISGKLRISEDGIGLKEEA